MLVVAFVELILILRDTQESHTMSRSRYFSIVIIVENQSTLVVGPDVGGNLTSHLTEDVIVVSLL